MATMHVQEMSSLLGNSERKFACACACGNWSTGHLGSLRMQPHGVRIPNGSLADLDIDTDDESCVCSKGLSM